MILLLVQWFNTALPFCSFHAKSFCRNHPDFFYDWIPHGNEVLIGKTAVSSLLPLSVIAIFHSRSLLTHKLRLGSVQIACLERYKNQIIVSSTIKSRRIFCQLQPAEDTSKLLHSHIQYHAYSQMSSCRYAGSFTYLSIHVFLSVPWLFILWQSHEGSEPQCLPSKWEHPVALSFSYPTTSPCHVENLHILISNLNRLFAYRFCFPSYCIHWHWCQRWACNLYNTPICMPSISLLKVLVWGQTFSRALVSFMRPLGLFAGSEVCVWYKVFLKKMLQSGLFPKACFATQLFRVDLYTFFLL